MATLADLFNPTFLMFLGILVLVVALLVVYFESKMREQNHKIASMLSLVSTLAEDMNGVKLGLNHLAIRGVHSDIPPVRENLGNSKLIEVSDDEEESDNEEEVELDDDNTDKESNSEENSREEESLEMDSESDSESEYSADDIKVVKLQVSNEDMLDNRLHDETNDLEEDLACLDDFETNDELPEMTDDYVEEVLDLQYELEEQKEERAMPSESDLKTLSINLGEELAPNQDIDYKKLQLAKLRSIVVEKGLTSHSEAAKLKKPELLKLLGIE